MSNESLVANGTALPFGVIAELWSNDEGTKDASTILSRLIAAFWRDEFLPDDVRIDWQQYVITRQFEEAYDPKLNVFEPISRATMIGLLYNSGDPLADAWMSSNSRIVIKEAVAIVKAGTEVSLALGAKVIVIAKVGEGPDWMPPTWLPIVLPDGSEGAIDSDLIERDYCWLAGFKYARYSPMGQEIISDCLVIERRALATWCDEQGFQRPAFLVDSADEGGEELADQAPLVGSDDDGAVANAASGQARAIKTSRHARTSNMQRDSELRKKIDSVLTAAKRRWPSPTSRPDNRQMARLLVQTGNPDFQFAEETIRKILGGHYGPAKRLGIGRLAG